MKAELDTGISSIKQKMTDITSSLSDQGRIDTQRTIDYLEEGYRELLKELQDMILERGKNRARLKGERLVRKDTLERHMEEMSEVMEEYSPTEKWYSEFVVSKYCAELKIVPPYEHSVSDLKFHCS